MNQINTKAFSKTNIENIQRFLSSFKYYPETSKISQAFLSDNTIYSKESLIPDIWLKTKCPINKNLAFLDCFCQKGRKSKKDKPLVVPPNFYPKKPLIISPESDLIKRNVYVEKKEMIVQENDIFAGLLNKTWIVNLMHYNTILNYGPMNSLRVYSFLKNVYASMSKEEKEKKSIMIVDTAFDIHYQPETLMQLLEEECNKKKKKEEIKKDSSSEKVIIEDNKTNYSSNNSNLNL